MHEVKIWCLQSPKPDKSKDIVTFVDAPQQDYGAAGCIPYDNGNVTSRPIAAKSKVALLNPMTVPRL